MLASVQPEVAQLAATQARCVRDQTQLDAASLQRIGDTQPNVPVGPASPLCKAQSQSAEACITCMSWDAASLQRIGDTQPKVLVETPPSLRTMPPTLQGSGL